MFEGLKARITDFKAERAREEAEREELRQFYIRRDGFYLPGMYVVESGGPPIPPEGWTAFRDPEKPLSPEVLTEAFNYIIEADHRVVEQERLNSAERV